MVLKNTFGPLTLAGQRAGGNLAPLLPSLPHPWSLLQQEVVCVLSRRSPFTHSIRNHLESCSHRFLYRYPGIKHIQDFINSFLIYTVSEPIGHFLLLRST